MTILHSGTTKQYSANWAQAFGRPTTTKSASGKAVAKKRATAKKKAGKKAKK